MIKRLLLFLAILGLSSNAFAFTPAVVCSGGVAAGGSCETPEFTNDTRTTDTVLGNSETLKMYAGGINDTGGTITVCAVSFQLERINNGNAVVAQIWTVTANDLDTQKGSDSSTVAGLDITQDNSGEMKLFTFGTPIDLDDGDAIVVTLETPASYSSSHFLNYQFHSPKGTGINYGLWNTDGSLSTTDTNQTPTLIIWTQ